MSFDANLAAALMDTEKRFQPGVWLPINGSTKLSAGFAGQHRDIDRLESKILISNGSTDKACFTLLMRILGKKQMWRIYGFDWNPTTPHINPFIKGNPYSGLTFKPGQSHEHHFKNRATDNNPDALAAPVTINPKNFDEALSFFCDRVNVLRPPNLPTPPAQGKLL